jgi:L-gulono-1,4-lactone dehydrogenase
MRENADMRFGGPTDRITARLTGLAPKLAEVVQQRRGDHATPPRWTNWAGNQMAQPLSVVAPTTEDELVAGVRASLAAGRRLRAVGNGHSFTAAAVADQTMFDMRGFNNVLRADKATGLVTVQAGIALSKLNQQLDALGLAMPNLGDIAYQSISGAISTGTHGTGAALGGLAAQVRELQIVTGTGELLTLTGDEMKLAIVGLGAFGVISTVTLQCVPSFNLHVVNAPMKLDKVLGQFDELSTVNDHFEFYWVPHTKWALTKKNNRTEVPPSPRSKASSFVNDYLFENIAFGALTKVGKFRPDLIPRLATAAPSSGRVEFVDRSFDVFTSPRLVKFVEQEYAIPQEAVPEALMEVTRIVDKRGYQISFPVEVRVTAADDVALSTAYGRDSGYIAVHMVKGSDHVPYFRDVEDIMKSYDGRPHWGKLHTRTYDDLHQTYPQMEAVRDLRRKLDPDGLCANPYVTQVLGAL